MSWQPSDEQRHPWAEVEEWTFTFWTADGGMGGISGHRLLGRRAWYWAALAQRGEPLLHVAEWDVAVRADPWVVKAEALWAEHTCDAPFDQWSISSEAHAAALDDPAEALDRAFGRPTPLALDLEWYATGAPTEIPDGYRQDGVVHGVVEVAGRPRIELVEAPADRTHRWGAALAPLERPAAIAHLGLRAAFAFPDGTVADWVLAASGWHRRAGHA